MGAAEQAATKAAEAYLNNGVLGLTALVFILLFLGSLWVIRGLLNDIKDSHKTALNDRERMITVLQGVAESGRAVQVTLDGVRLTLETRGQAIGDLSHQLERSSQDTRHSLGNLAAAMDAIARWIQSARTGSSEKSGGQA